MSSAIFTSIFHGNAMMRIPVRIESNVATFFLAAMEANVVNLRGIEKDL